MGDVLMVGVSGCHQMLAVRRSLTEILLEVTDSEIQTVSQEEVARYNAAQGITRLYQTPDIKTLIYTETLAY